MKIYTRTGDQGSTALFAGGRVEKDDLRVEAYGTVDEANAAIGLAVAAAGRHPDLVAKLRRIQQELFDAGADLADPRALPDSTVRPPMITARHVERLEQDIDETGAQLQPLRQFILPGGTELAARLHMARTIVRRAERRAVSAAAVHQLNPEIIRYLNRLSDLLFVLARLANQAEGAGDIPWEPSSPEQ